MDTKRPGPHLREVERLEAIQHALWEAHECIGRWALCACLAMLRKAIDLWSALYRDKHGLKFDREAKEQDNIYWRLRKIAEANPLYQDSIHEIIDALRLDANDAVHDSVICAGGQPGKYDDSMIMAIQGPAQHLHAVVMNLISSTTSRFTPVYSDMSRWRRGRPLAVTASQPRKPMFSPDSGEARILAYLARLSSGERVTSRILAVALRLSETKTDYHIDNLLEQEMVHRHMHTGEPIEYSLAKPGREFLNKLGFI